jgi:hypothetical protein
MMTALVQIKQLLGPITVNSTSFLFPPLNFESTTGLVLNMTELQKAMLKKEPEK